MYSSHNIIFPQAVSVNNIHDQIQLLYSLIPPYKLEFVHCQTPNKYTLKSFFFSFLFFGGGRGGG